MLSNRATYNLKLSLISPYSTVHLFSLDGLVFNILNFVKTKVTAELTCMFGDVCPYAHPVTWLCWRDTTMGHPTSQTHMNKKYNKLGLESNSI